ncbi:cAMP-binding proteins - catabolite gene activator and regulatory subunit of cAMP-dependent protein kinases [hydrothermal vent metagenome]|uniref:cAMP-binding proteins - catabolite gene activator and regulatory subunit of cAMP-dependent protein kinases n=1 Tax=hydrothermal vent metagenome TaxID=652676 RepID=A0A3B0YVZ5_9ZZZZ
MILQNIPLFANLPKKDLETLTQRAITKNYPKNTILVSEGDETNSLFVIDSGKVKVFLSDHEGKEIVINVHGKGDYFGEIALLDDAPRSASVMTTEPCRVVLILKRDFEECLGQNPSIALCLLKDLTHRLRTLTDNVKSLALMDVYGRVARVLLNMASVENGKWIIAQRVTQKEIANRVGASREMVSRIMKDLTEGGYITVSKHGIVINQKLPENW